MMRQTHNAKDGDSKDVQKLYVNEREVIERAFAQYLEADGGAYPMTVDEDNNLVPTDGGYHEDGNISALDVCEHLGFKNISNIGEHTRAHQAVRNFEGLVDRIEIGGQTYEVKNRF